MKSCYDHPYETELVVVYRIHSRRYGFLTRAPNRNDSFKISHRNLKILINFITTHESQHHTTPISPIF